MSYYSTPEWYPTDNPTMPEPPGGTSSTEAGAMVQRVLTDQNGTNTILGIFVPGPQIMAPHTSPDLEQIWEVTAPHPPSLVPGGVPA
ncbi:MAG: hypothetical protein ACP5QO_14500 [Clostridia bacterium]